MDWISAVSSLYISFNIFGADRKIVAFYVFALVRLADPFHIELVGTLEIPSHLRLYIHNSSHQSYRFPANPNPKSLSR